MHICTWIIAVTAAGGEVKKADDSHIGIANEIIINENGLAHPIYKDKEKIFNSPAFNFDEVRTLPRNAVCLASIKLIKYKVFILKLTVPMFGVYNIIQK